MNLRPTILIDLSSEHIDFTFKKQSIHFAAYMNVQIHDGDATPIAIGEKQEYPNSILLGIYDFDEIAKLNLKKTALLKLMMDYGIGKLFERLWYPPRKPLVIFRGHKNLAGMLGYEYKKSLEEVAIQAQAWKVEFE